MTTIESNTGDKWESTSSEVMPHRHKSKRSAPAPVVPDDWDNDDGDDEDEDNAKIWEEANTKTPMPDVIIAPSSTGLRIASPPVAALQSPMRILKRPSASTTTTTSTSSSSSLDAQSRQTLAEREAQYLLARDRIFGESKGEVSSATDKGNGKQRWSKGSKSDDLSTTGVIRNPLGPDSIASSSSGKDSDNAARGFRNRRNVREGADSTIVQSR